MEINKQEIIAKFGRKEGDTGSPEVQIRVAYGAHQSFDRTPQNTQKGPPQQTRSASNGRTEARFARLSQSK